MARPLANVFFLLLLFLLQSLKIRAFSSQPATETVGGLIHDEIILTDRLRIEEESMAQLNKSITTSNSSGVSIFCPTEELKFRHSDLELMNISCNLTYSNLASPLAVSFETDIQDIAILSPAFWIYLSPSTDKKVINAIPLPISVRTFRMGSTFLKVWVREAKPGGECESIHPFSRQNSSQEKEYYDWIMKTSSLDNETSAMGFHLRILRPRGAFEFAFRIIIVILVCGITFLMGCELDGRQIWMHMKKPIGPIIGFLCQFALMPLIAFGIGMVVPIKPEFGFGLLTTGCCPGGGGSNIWTVLLHGDLNLSMTMTFFSSIFALGMMPLMLFIFGRFFIDIRSLSIPYLTIAGQLCYVCVPVLIGMLVKWRLPQVGKKMVKLLRPLSFLFIAFIIGFGVYCNLPIYRLLGVYPILIPTATALPWIGFLLAGLLAFFCRRPRAEILTISIETGIQSSGIAILVLIYTMPQPEGDIGAAMPIVISIFTPLPLAAALITQKIRESSMICCRKRKNGGKTKHGRAKVPSLDQKSPKSIKYEIVGDEEAEGESA
ncbi:hypothetical protein Aperf_G00000124578 [Anoplocephala perfoliata]